MAQKIGERLAASTAILRENLERDSRNQFYIGDVHASGGDRLPKGRIAQSIVGEIMGLPEDITRRSPFVLSALTGWLRVVTVFI
jgi:hypothetical protein